MDQLADLVFIFFADARVRTVIGLIAADFLIGTAAALKRGEFEWKRVADFYQHNVFPYVICYLGFYIGSKLVVGELMGEYAYIVGEAAHYVTWLAIVASLANDIIAHLKTLGLETVVGATKKLMARQADDRELPF